jgi:UDP-N-acetylglucosamine 1-carboxyvinyltransferase
MYKMCIEGRKVLKGSVQVGGAKNAALPIIAASLLAGGWHHLSRVPHLKDVETLRTIMTQMGVLFREEDGSLSINSENLKEYTAPYELVKTMRASVLLLGPLLARLGRAKISLPGGCAIGARPIDLHLKALAAMGVEMHLEQGYVNARVDRLKGATIFFDISTVTGTENLMMVAVKGEGKTTLRNAAREPEICDLADALRAMGAHIQGDGTDTIVIEGVDSLRPLAHHSVIADRIEAGTFMIASAITQGEILLQGCEPNHLPAITEKLRLAGAVIEHRHDGLFIKGPDRIESVDIVTLPYPGFPTDLQAQFMALMSVASGSSMIKETIFENRFIHVSELLRMGAEIEIDGNQALVRGQEKLLAAQVMATDLRASASLILAGLVAEQGITEVSRIYHLDRGYESLEDKFQSLGATIWREKA